MHKDDISYGQVLLTGEIAFYLQHPKGRLITDKNKTDFIKRWIGRRLKQKLDQSAVRRYLKEIRSSKFPSRNWHKALSSYSDYVERCKAYKKLEMTDRKLMNCVIEQIKAEGFIVKEDVIAGDTFTKEEARIDAKHGSMIIMKDVNALFADGTVPSGEYIKVIVTSKKLLIRATEVLESFCFPVQCTSKNEVIALRSAEEQIDMVLKMVSK